MARITMKDVASVMGVSVMTVSNAFNRPDQLSPDLRRRILARAEKMGYAGPSAAARALRQGRSNTYGVVFLEPLSHVFRDTYSVEWLVGFTEAVEQSGSSITLFSIPGDDDADLDPIRNAVVDGVAGMCASHPAMAMARGQRLPVVAGDPGAGDYVSIDEAAAGRALAGHLTALGHQRVTLVVPASFRAQEAPALRTIEAWSAELAAEFDEGYLARWERANALVEGLAGCDVDVLVVPRLEREGARAAAGVILDRRDRPTAIAALSDVVAVGILDALAERGIVAGREITVTGYDDIAGAAAAGLTTIRQPVREKGRHAAELLLDPDRSPRQVVLPHELVVRASSGPAPS